MVGSVIWEYLTPLMEDPFIMHEMITYFFFELYLIGKKDIYELALRIIRIHYSPE
jgi:hypothetical protein